MEASKLKSQTILSMRQEIEELQAELTEAEGQFGDQRADLQTLVQAAREERDQISNVYEQENRMRQELELQMDQVKSLEAEDKARVGELRGELSETHAKLEQEAIDKLKTE